jgi:hypothetical protein
MTLDTVTLAVEISAKGIVSLLVTGGAGRPRPPHAEAVRWVSALATPPSQI